MESFLSRFKNVLVLIAVLLLQLLLLAIQAKRPTPDARDRQDVSLARSVVTTLVTPPERALRATGEWFRGLWFGYIDLIHVRQENTGLKQQMERLQLEQASLAEDARQGQRLQKLLDFRQTYIYKTVPAQVIGTSGTEQSQVLYINKGSEDGLEPDMPVVTGDGIVGRIKDVFDQSAQVLLISDPTSGVGVILEKTRTRGVLKGNFNGVPQVINVSPDERIQSGDRILTSGGDQLFPRGLLVGTVDRVATDPDRDPLVDVTIHPAANLARLEEVLVVTNVGPSMSPQSEKDLAASEAEGEAAQKRASDILSERLPSKVDQTAPADTNPDANQNATGLTIRPIPPPKNLHADQYTPGTVPSAVELTPGARLAPLRRGTEELPKPKPGAITATTEGSAAAAGTAHVPASGGTGVPTRPVTGATSSSLSARPSSATLTPHPATAPYSVHPSAVHPAGETAGTMGPATRPSTITSHPASGTAAGTAGTPRTPSSSGVRASDVPAAGVPHSATSVTGTTHPGTPGSVPATPRPASGADFAVPRTGSPENTGAVTNTGTPANRTAPPHAATPIVAGQAKPHVNVIVDGPSKSATPSATSNKTPRPASQPSASTPSTRQGTPLIRQGASPSTTPGTSSVRIQGSASTSRTAGDTAKPVTHPASAAPTTTTQPVHHKGPIVVPDDGSRPPVEHHSNPQTTPPSGGN